MQRKFLEELGLEKDTIDKIMDENGKDINREKEKANSLKTQLDTAKETLKGFEGVDVAELQGKVAQLTSDLEAKDTEYQAKIADMEFNSVLDSAISASGAKNSKAVKALLDVDTLKSSKNQAEDIKNALEAVKTENDYMFGSKEPVNNVVHDTGSSPNNKKMTLSEAMAYKNAHPEVDVKTLI